jgi:uncharacterized membrane protein YoaK (UPF0700 family)
MLIRRGPARSHQLDRRLAFTLAGVAGSLNAAVFHAVGFFAANMTGNVSALSSLIAMGQWGHGLFYLAIVAVFIGGATVSSLAIDIGLRREVATIYARMVLAEAAMLVAIGLVGPVLHPDRRAVLLILGLSFLMGLQNAIVTHISEARVRTTHISGMATDVGIRLARLIALSHGKGTAEEQARTMARLRLHAGTIGSFLLGGILGVLLYRWQPDLAITLAALPLFATRIATLRQTAVRQGHEKPQN